MTNLLRFKYLKCMEWIMETDGSGENYTSETFSLQNQQCNLEFRSLCLLYFKIKGQLQSPVTVTVRVATADGTFARSTKTTDAVTADDTLLWEYEYDYHLYNKKLTMEVMIHADFSKDDKSVQTPSYIDSCYLMKEMSHDFSMLLNEGSHQDVTFTCGDETIKAHKSVLCCRSKYFASMLQSDMVEGKTGQVNIQDMEPTTLQLFLKCLYTGCLPEITLDSAMKLYEASDKYNCSALLKQCAEFLSDNLAPDNACDILIIADRHNDSDLKKNALEYIIQEKIPFTGDKWMAFCDDHSKLATEVLNLFCQHLRPNST